MKTLLTLLLVLIPCNGCMMMEDMLFVEDGPPQGYPAYQSAAQPPGTCGSNVANVAASQTAEPELLQVRK